MKMLLCGCGALALLAGLGRPAFAQGETPSVEVRDAPVHAVPSDAAQAAGAPGDPAMPIAADVHAQPALNDDERAFFAAVGHRVTNAASAYDGYLRNADRINPSFASPAAVQSALRTGADYQPEQLQEGMIAFVALIALRNQAFVDGVRDRGDPNFAARLLHSPRAVLDVPGAREAVADVTGVLQAHGAGLAATGEAISHAAYDVQQQSWSSAPVANPGQVLAGVVASGDDPRTADEPDEKALLRTLVSTPRSPSDAEPSTAVVHGLALAALAVLGRTGDGEESDIEILLREPATADCLKLARSELNECLAAAGPHYEDVFCAGHHAVAGTAKCISQAATGGTAEQPAVEVARREDSPPVYGPEAARAYGRPAPADVGGDAAPPQAEDSGPRDAAHDRYSDQSDESPPTPANRPDSREEAYGRYGDQSAPADQGPPTPANRPDSREEAYSRYGDQSAPADQGPPTQSDYPQPRDGGYDDYGYEAPDQPGPER
jgi:hypothetical protein